MHLKRLIRTHLCPLLLAASMTPLVACGAGVREEVVDQPPPVVAALPPEPQEEIPTVPVKPDKYYERGVTKVGLLLPLSGRNAALGEAMLDAAQLALFDIGDPGIVLLPRDTEGKGAGAAAQDAIDDGAQVLLGPIFADAIRAAGPVARHYRIPLIGFSTDRTVAGNGVYILGFTPQQQVERIVEYAIRQGKRRIAALVPQSPYGTMVAEALRSAAARHGGTVVAVEMFPETEEALAGPIERLAARKVARPIDPASLPPPVPGAPPFVPQPVYDYEYDALLIATGGALLRTLAPMLPYYDIDPGRVQFLGTGLWDDPGLRGEETLAGAWYAGPAPEAGAAFASRYAAAYGGTAPRVSSIAYDAVALVAALKKLRPERPFAADALTSPKGFAGLDGAFRFGPDGVAERGLAVMRIGPAGAVAIDLPPAQFAPPVARP
jgi:branched-chain amino acid transport system substrate-binding protein